MTRQEILNYLYQRCDELKASEDLSTYPVFRAFENAINHSLKCGDINENEAKMLKETLEHSIDEILKIRYKKFQNKLTDFEKFDIRF